MSLRKFANSKRRRMTVRKTFMARCVTMRSSKPSSKTSSGSVRQRLWCSRKLSVTRCSPSRESSATSSDRKSTRSERISEPRSVPSKKIAARSRKRDKSSGKMKSWLGSSRTHLRTRSIFARASFTTAPSVYENTSSPLVSPPTRRSRRRQLLMTNLRQLVRNVRKRRSNKERSKSPLTKKIATLPVN